MLRSVIIPATKTKHKCMADSLTWTQSRSERNRRIVVGRSCARIHNTSTLHNTPAIDSFPHLISNYRYCNTHTYTHAQRTHVGSAGMMIITVLASLLIWSTVLMFFQHATSLCYDYYYHYTVCAHICIAASLLYNRFITFYRSLDTTYKCYTLVRDSLDFTIKHDHVAAVISPNTSICSKGRIPSSTAINNKCEQSIPLPHAASERLSQCHKKNIYEYDQMISTDVYARIFYM